MQRRKKRSDFSALLHNAKKSERVIIINAQQTSPRKVGAGRIIEGKKSSKSKAGRA
jgi:hypothetical protein